VYNPVSESCRRILIGLVRMEVGSSSTMAQKHTSGAEAPSLSSKGTHGTTEVVPLCTYEAALGMIEPELFQSGLPDAKNITAGAR
jgi:hypothetical protein